jgi:drug/metabolite transporter (DMT)-like permease
MLNATYAKPKTGLWQGIVANILWGTSFLATKHTLMVWAPITASALRFTIATIALFLGMKATSYEIQIPNGRNEWTWVILTAILGFGLLYPFQAKGLTLIPSSLSAIIMLTSPLVVVAISSLMGFQATQRKWIAVTLGMIGGTILIIGRSHVVGADDVSMTGISLTLAASVCLAASSVTAKKALSTLNQGSLTFWSMLFGALILAPLAYAEKQPILQASVEIWLCVLYLAIVCSVVAFFLWNHALSHGDPMTIASTMHLKTPVAVLLGCFLNSEHLGWTAVLGGVLVGIGIWSAGQKKSLIFISVAKEVA